MRDSLQKFYCNVCIFQTNNKKDYDRHLLTLKHMKLTNSHFFSKMNNLYCEDCNRPFRSKSGLWKHKKMCNNISCQPSTNNITPNLILNILEQNKELTHLVIEQNKTMLEMSRISQNNYNICNNNINSNNKTFNLQFFLNETCKDAMNITDFVDSLKIQLSDLENVGKVGFIEGISNIIVKNLQALDVHKRPVHCADKKREVIYIKDKNKWEREDEEKNKIRNVIKTVARKNQRLLSKYKEEHPGCNFSESKYSDQYSKIVIEVMGGIGTSDADNENKIIQKIAKEVVIDKIALYK